VKLGVVLLKIVKQPVSGTTIGYTRSWKQ